MQVYFQWLCALSVIDNATETFSFHYKDKNKLLDSETLDKKTGSIQKQIIDKAIAANIVMAEHRKTYHSLIHSLVNEILQYSMNLEACNKEIYHSLQWQI